jgi:hypothetical protein
MNTGVYFTCLGYYGISTGSSANIEGIYAPNSGTTGFLYNQLYPPEYHQTGGVIFSPALPLVNVGNLNVTGFNFHSRQCLRAGYKHSGNFSVLMDIEYSGCLRNQAVGLNNVLLTTVDRPSGLSSGFALCINDANRLLFKTADKGYTLAEELEVHDIVYMSLTENQYATFGIYKVNEGKLYSKQIALTSGQLNTDSIYFGNFLNPATPYTGYSGKMNQILIFNDDLSNRDLSVCADCSLVTGYNIVNTFNNFSGAQITGFVFSPISVLANLGTAYLTGQIRKNDGSSIPVIYSSGISGYQNSGEVATPLYASIALQTSGYDLSFIYDANNINTFTRRRVEFDIMLTSGDTVEVYTYQRLNRSIGKPIINATWPSDTGVIQLIGNGLTETSGVDFFLSHNTISGFNLEDILYYDVLSSPTVVTPYSGYWLNSRTLMSGGTYFPPAAQYTENTSFSGQVKITGLNQISVNNPFSPVFGYDLYMNGQKLVSGLQYGVNLSGSNFIVSLSGLTLPTLNADFLYHPTGGLPTGVGEVYDNELTFIPWFSGANRVRSDISGNVKFLGMITGFSPQIWVNGVRQTEDVDYMLHGNCDLVTGIIYEPNMTFNAYQSITDTQSRWNLKLPYTIGIGAVTGSYNVLDNTQVDLRVNWTFTPPSYFYDYSGNYVEIWLGGNYGGYSLQSQGNLLSTSGTFTVSGGNFFTGNARVRYRNGNIIGPWSPYSNTFSINY